MMIEALKELPRNANQLANDLELDYKTIRHHLEVLVKNGMVTATGKGYGTTYFLSSDVKESYLLFEKIWEKIGKNKKNERRGT